MRNFQRIVLDTLQIVAIREAEHESYEICATAIAEYDENSRELAVELDAFVRRFEMRGKDPVFRPAWLPRKDRVRSHADLDEASTMAKDIFKTWTANVRRSVPEAGEWRTAQDWLEEPVSALNAQSRFSKHFSQNNQGLEVL